MFVEIVFAGLPIDRDEVEEALDTVFGPDGEITGAGSGAGRCHLDLEIEEASIAGWHWNGFVPCWPGSACGSTRP